MFKNLPFYVQLDGRCVKAHAKQQKLNGEFYSPCSLRRTRYQRTAGTNSGPYKSCLFTLYSTNLRFIGSLVAVIKITIITAVKVFSDS
jgi:hypothetical protein